MKKLLSLMVLGFVFGSSVAMAGAPCFKIDATQAPFGDRFNTEECGPQGTAIIRLNRGAFFKLFANNGAKCALRPLQRMGQFETIGIKFAIDIDTGANCQLFIRDPSGKTGTVGFAAIGS